MPASRGVMSVVIFYFLWNSGKFNYWTSLALVRVIFQYLLAVYVQEVYEIYHVAMTRKLSFFSSSLVQCCCVPPMNLQNVISQNVVF